MRHHFSPSPTFPIAAAVGLGLLASLLFPMKASSQISIGGGSTISSGGWSLTGTDPIEIRWAGEVVTVYQTSASLPKPFFYPLIGPTGENVTRHYPMKEGVAHEATDHLHHRSLWFGIGSVNGLDFWHEPGSQGKEGTKFGRTVHTGLSSTQIKGQEKAIVLKTGTDWLDHQTGAKICQDRRTIRLECRDDGGFALDFTVTLEASEGDVTLRDTEECGLAIRMMPSLQLEGPAAKGAARNSEGVTGRDVWGRRARWVSYDGEDSQGRALGIALFDHPTSFRHPTWWHARHYGLCSSGPFGQGHFEKDAPKTAGDHLIRQGDSLTLRYRVLIHAGKADAGKLEEEFRVFADTK
ncbi:MAG: PmoA family protein [Verrucomicrobiales bacterium]|nr:PmoA family protein [Verrucomicrobiales bacterium]